MQLFLFLALFIAIALVLFAVQNSDIVTMSFLTFQLEGSLAFVMVIVFAAGFLAGILFFIPMLLRKGAALREQKRRVRQLEEGMSRFGTPDRPSAGAEQERDITDIME